MLSWKEVEKYRYYMAIEIIFTSVIPAWFNGSPR